MMLKQYNHHFKNWRWAQKGKRNFSCVRRDLTTTELVMIEAYVEEGSSVLKMAQLLKRSRQTIHKMVTFLKQGNSASDYYQHYKANKSRCGLVKLFFLRMKRPSSKVI